MHPIPGTWLHTESRAPAVIAVSTTSQKLNFAPPRRVILLEDNDINAMVAREFLELNGAEDIVHVQTLAEFALHADAIVDGAFDMVIADIMLPDGLANAALKALRDDGCEAVIAAYTARDTDTDCDEYRSIGVDYVFRKPLSLSDFEAGLKTLFDMDV